MGDSGFGELFVSGFRSVFGNILSYVPVTLIFAAISCLIMIPGSWLLTSLLSSGSTGWAFLFQLFFAFLASILFALYNLVVTKIAGDLYTGTDSSLGEALTESLPKVPYLIIVSIITSFLIGIASMLCGFPGLIVSVFLALVVPAIALGDAGLSAPRESYELVQGRWWQTFFLFLLYGLIVGLIGFLIMAPVMFMMMTSLTGFLKGEGGLLMVLPLVFLTALIGYFLWNFFIVLTAHLYLDYAGVGAGPGAGAAGGQVAHGGVSATGWGSLPIRRG